MVLMKKTPLKRRTPLRKVSDKQRIKNKLWADITDEKAKELNYICEYCGKKGQRVFSEGWDYLDGHHKIKRRFNVHTKENCQIVHRINCHTEVDRIKEV